MSKAELLAAHMAEVDAELLRWEKYEWAGSDTMGTVNIVDFWKAHRWVFPLLYQVAMDVLPVQASSVSSERAFSSSKLTCTRERNKISAVHMEELQVLKHSLHRRRADERNKISAVHMEELQVLKHSLHRRRADDTNRQTLDFMAHIVDPVCAESSDSDSE
ncbi:hypothetical protein RSAG8_08349, partial [Rhizoctonia solani AG-8 WAC10335]